ncbi:O-antigen ligase family protein [Hymenobacter sp. HD11105]|jgi:hypothetical protein
MKIHYRLLYIVPLLAILILDPLFSDLLAGGKTNTEGLSSGPYPAFLIALCIPISILLYKYLKGISRYVFWLALIGMSLLMAESYLQYNVPAIYPHVFQKVMVLFALTALYGIYELTKRITLTDLVGVIWVGLILNLAIVNSDSLSMGAFVDHDRGLHASSVYLLVLPLLFHFNSYLHTRKSLHLMLFFLVAGLILFFQHRTVWVVSIASLSLNGLLLLRTARQRLDFKTLLPLFGIPAIIIFLALSTLAATNPKILLKIADDISDIENHDKQGTGGWRAEQARSYWPFIEDNPVVGMRFQGFELPIQFYDPDQPWLVVFPDGNGHFLHSYYIDSLFYLGVVGLLLLSLPQLHILYQMVRSPAIDPEAMAWSVFIATSLLYGYSYALPSCFYGIVGLGLVRIRQLAELNVASTQAHPHSIEKESPSAAIPYSA